VTAGPTRYARASKIEMRSTVAGRHTSVTESGWASRVL
jgi:hypothetical protein